MSTQKIIHDLPKWRPLVWSIVRRFGFSGEDAEDMVSDIMLKAMSKASEFDPARAKLSTWVGSIAKWAACERRRNMAGRQGRKPMPVIISLTDALMGNALAQPVAQDQIEREEMIDRFRRAAISAQEHEIVAMCLSECGVRAMAERLGVSATRVHQIIADLRKRAA